MQLTTFDKVSVGKYSRRLYPEIRFHRHGSCTLNIAAVQLTGYEPGDQIAVHQNPETGDWYFSLSEAGYLMRYASDKKTLAFNSAMIANLILEHLNISNEFSNFRVGREAKYVDQVPYWPIITANPIIKIRPPKNHPDGSSA